MKNPKLDEKTLQEIQRNFEFNATQGKIPLQLVRDNIFVDHQNKYFGFCRHADELNVNNWCLQDNGYYAYEVNDGENITSWTKWGDGTERFITVEEASKVEEYFIETMHTLTLFIDIEVIYEQDCIAGVFAEAVQKFVR